MKPSKATRREFLKSSAAAALTAGAAGSFPALAANFDDPGPAYPKGKAQACIFIWLGGGAAHLDMWDPKVKGDGKKKSGSYYDAIDTAVPGVQVCEHLSHTAALMDRVTLVRTLTHDITDEHGAATNLVHTGRKPSGTIIYPSLGAVVSHERGPQNDNVPAYVVMGYPNIARDPGFLGPKYGYVYLTQIETGPNGFVLPPDVDLQRQQRREGLLSAWRQDFSKRHAGDQVAKAQSEVSEKGFQMAGPEFTSVFDLTNESQTLRESYGNEFGQRCLLARRLVQSGVRFIEVSFNLNFLNGTGWDTHNDGQLRQYLLIQDLDKAFATLIRDLEKNGLLDTTILAIATEFGRPAEFDSGGGRGHQSHAFSAVLAGGGLRNGQVIGETDELADKALGRTVSIPDFHATIHCDLGIDPSKKLYDGKRPVPITDYGKPITELFA